MWLARARLREMDECVEVRRYQPTDVPRRPARPKRPVGRPKKRCPTATDAQTSSPRPESCQQSDKEEQTASRGVCRSYSLRQQLEIVRYVRQHSEDSPTRGSHTAL